MASTAPTPKKSLGQHWLEDEISLESIATAIKVSSKDTVLEIGAGPGFLTSILLTKAKDVVAVELDSNLAKLLTKKLPNKNLRVINKDILHFDLLSLQPNYKVVANIPYYLTSNLLRYLCESPNPFEQAAILIQKEVAQRVTAKPGQMSLLSVSVQFYAEAELGPLISADKFSPPPKVDSMVLILRRRPSPLFPGIDDRLFFRVVKAGFNQRRKTLLNSLSGGLSLGRTKTETLLHSAGLNPSDRAQTLRLEDWYRLYQKFKALSPSR